MFLSTMRCGAMFLLAALLALSIGCNKATSDNPAEEPTAQSAPGDSVAVATLATHAAGSSSFKVAGMTCGDCSAAIETQLSKLDGVSQVSADWQNGIVTVAYDPARIDSGKLSAGIEELKFTVEGPADSPALADHSGSAVTGQRSAEDYVLASRVLDNGHVEATFGVDGMTCAGCEGSVSSCVKKIEGVDSVVASRETRTAVITYDPAIANPAVLLASLSQSGFPLQLKEGTAAAAANKPGCCGGCKDKAAAKAAHGEACCGQCKAGQTCAADCQDKLQADEAKHEEAVPGHKDATQASLLQRLLAGIFPAAHAAEEEGKPKVEKPKLPKLPAVAKGCERVTFTVEYCCSGGCPPKTEEAVKALKGVAYVKADYPTLTCTVDYRAKEITKDQIKHAILDLGYVVDGEQPETPHED